jgi:chemotaxis signal transduction protein
MRTGYVLFRLGGRTFATTLDEVREIVRLEGLQTLPGAEPPLAGMVELRGAPLPVLDVRPTAAPRGGGDVLVLERSGEMVGVAVDSVVAVLQPEELPLTDAPTTSLPSYVLAVHRHGETPVLLVNLEVLLAAG